MPDMNENAETQQEYFGKAKKGKVVEHFEAYGQCRDSRRIAKLEAENERLTVSYETLKLHDEEEIGVLKSENAELKRDKEDLIFIRNQNAKCMCEDKERFTKAKELLKQWLQTSNASSCDNINIVTDTEQFLNSEVEK
jgi:hypothetical protein